MRFSDIQYASADFINRWARGAMVLVILIVIAAAVVVSAFGDEEPDVEVLSAQADSLTPTSVTLAPFGDLVLRLNDTTTTTLNLQSETRRTSGATSTTLGSTTTTTRQRTTTTTSSPTTTTTTLPPTTTTTSTTTTTTSTTTSTTFPPADDWLFLEDLRGSASGSGEGWAASVQVTIDSTDRRANLRDAAVNVTWSGAYSGTATESPNRQGRVTFETPTLGSGQSVTLRVTSILHPVYAYNPKLNEDELTITIFRDADSDSIVFFRSLGQANS